MRAVIVDDEQDGVETVSKILDLGCKDVEIVGMANSAIEAIKLINTKKPDIVFLDIEMPHGNGFDVLEGTTDRNYNIIFTTAYNHYAIRALKANAIDYLMKPIDIDELVGAVEKVKSIGLNQKEELNSNLLDSLKNDKISKLPILDKGAYIFVKLDSIIYFKSDGAYAEIVTSDNKYISSKSLKYYDDLLSECNFFRINNSYLINLNEVVKYIKEGGGTVEMRNKIKIMVSKTKSKEAKAILGL